MEIEIIKTLVSEFLEKLMIQTESLEVLNEQENVFFIKLKTPDSSLFIGYSWKNLEDIRNILKNLIIKKLGKNIILHLEVNDYLSKKDDKLYAFVAKKVELIKKLQKEIIFPYFNAYERKKIHSYISELNDSSIYTKSVWEDEQRRIHLCYKSKTMTIDIDWIDI